MGIQIHFWATHVNQESKVRFNTNGPGFTYHTFGDWKETTGMDVISFCNKEYLEHLPQIRKYARTTSWVNCMTWNFPLEQKRHAEGLIDLHLYQTPHAHHRVAGGLPQPQPRTLEFTPYFDNSMFPLVSNRSKARVTFGHISRSDPAKFHPETWNVWNKIRSPVEKRGLVMAWSERIEKKIGPPPAWVRTMKTSEMSQQDFYNEVDVVLMYTQTYENLPRVGFESMSSGSVLCVVGMGGWRLQVKDGISGFVFRSPHEAFIKATALAEAPDLRQSMAQEARMTLERGWGLEPATKSWQRVFETIAAVR